MAIRYAEGDASGAIFEGRCVAEEADALVEWLRRTYEPVADLAACTDLHSALMQVLLATRLPVSQLPADAFLAGLLADNRQKVMS